MMRRITLTLFVIISALLVGGFHQWYPPHP